MGLAQARPNDGTCTRDPNMNLIQYGLLGLVLGLGLFRVYFILQDLAPPGTTVHVPTTDIPDDGTGEGYPLHQATQHCVFSYTVLNRTRVAND